MYYDPDTDIKITYDDWKALDEASWNVVVIMIVKNLILLMRYLQLQSEGRDQEAQELAEVPPPLFISSKCWC